MLICFMTKVGYCKEDMPGECKTWGFLMIILLRYFSIFHEINIRLIGPEIETKETVIGHRSWSYSKISWFE